MRHKTSHIKPIPLLWVKLKAIKLRSCSLELYHSGRENLRLCCLSHGNCGLMSSTDTDDVDCQCHADLPNAFCIWIINCPKWFGLMSLSWLSLWESGKPLRSCHNAAAYRLFDCLIPVKQKARRTLLQHWGESHIYCFMSVPEQSFCVLNITTSESNRKENIIFHKRIF